jgi:CubicO group peptidase (beta-lactamase class C family)
VSTDSSLLNGVAQAIPAAERFVLAQTRQDRPVIGIRLGSETASGAIWVQARQHAWESGGSWVGDGLLRWIASDDPAAVALRDTHEIYFIPIMDVDNVTLGAGGKEAIPRDHNRDWADTPVYPEVAAAQQHLRALADSGRLRVFLDLHNPGPNDQRPFFFGPLDYDQMSATRRRPYDRFLELATEHIRGPLAVDPRYRFATYVKTEEERNRVSGTWARNYAGDDVIAMTLETAWNTPHSTREGYQEVGRGLARTIAHYLQESAKERTDKSASGQLMTFPGDDWELTDPASQGIDATKLRAAVEYLKSCAGRDGVRELVVIRNGYLVYQGDNTDKMHNVWSCTKSFTSTVLGLLIDDNQCKLGTFAAEFVPELNGTYSGITLQHFATMTSGYQAVGDEGKSSHGQSKTPFVPSSQPLFSPPGSKYAYWDSAQNQFGQVLTQIAREPMADLFRRRIADPIGMKADQWQWGDFGQRGGQLVNGGAGNMSKGISISAQQMARLGHLMLNSGRWNGQQLISEQWVKQATSPQVPAKLPLGHPESGTSGPGVYGFNWWTNGANANGELKWEGAPRETFAALGHNNNVCFVVPSWKTVIVRLGLDQANHKITDEEWAGFLRRIGEAIGGD